MHRASGQGQASLSIPLHLNCLCWRQDLTAEPWLAGKRNLELTQLPASASPEAEC